MSTLFRDPLLNAAREAAAIAAHRMSAWADELSPVSVSSKDGKNDLVTEADAEIEALVRHRMMSLRPEDVVVGEEGTDALSLADHAAGDEVHSILLRAEQAAQRAAAANPAGPDPAGPDPAGPDPDDVREGVEWHIDPIDGTVNFVRGIEHYCFSAGARLHSAGPDAPDDGWVAGLVAAPMLDRVWFARAGAAWVAPLSALTDPHAPVRPLTGSSAPTTGRVVATGFGYAEDRRVQQRAALGRVMGQFDDIRRCGSAAIDLCMVAEGRVNAYYERGLGVYDFAGGAYVADCAGRFVRRRADAFLREDTGASIAVPPASAAPASPVSPAAPNAQVSPELTVVADTRERFEFLLANG
ncbi:inositol monophosphatase family protein [Brevibacterium jeotgali]|uniref:inositol monophosphatase family protein n=1 Tax=Brevibacterium jeotgali TaxID=1262550 RepID=UPI000C781F57|nr:inositol monophosphatase family protein [Brevibacterium jeotgali]